MNKSNYETVVNHYFVSNIEGQILTIIETLGLTPKQEEAVKSIIRREMWDSFHSWAVCVDHEEWKKACSNSEEVKKKYALEAAQGTPSI